MNNAGGQLGLTQPFSALSPSHLRRTFETNVYSAFMLTAAALPVMSEEGSIINTSSVEACGVGVKGMVDYASAKGALTSFTYALAQEDEVLKKRIRVNAVAPGPVYMPLNVAVMPAERLEEGVKCDTWMRRIAQPCEIAPSFVFLASNQLSSFMTGQVLHPNGGAAVHG